MSPFSPVWFVLCCWIYVGNLAVYGITTRTIPLNFPNVSDGAQYVQIRSNVNHHHHHQQQGSRNLLQHTKNALSPVQQTHILDDVQKNQRIHYHPNGPPPPLAPPPPPPFDQSYSKYANFFSLNSLSPPPVQTVVLSPQQTLPTTPPQVEQLPYFKPITHADTKAIHPHTHNVNTLSQIEPLKVPPEQPHFFPGPHYQPLPPPQLPHTTTHRSYVATRYPYFSKPDPLSPYSFEGTVAPTSSNQAKSHQNKDSNTAYTPLIEKTENSDFPSDSNKVIKEIVIKTNPEELIAKDRQKFFQQLLGEDKTLDESEHQLSDDQNVAQNDLSGSRGQFEQELIRQLKEGMALNGPVGDLGGVLLNSSNAISEFTLPDGQRIQVSKDYNRLVESEEDNEKIKTVVVKDPSTAGASPSYLLEELTKGVIPPGADFEVIKRNNDGRLEEVNKLPPNLPQKKVTFVILEEQSDGTVKVQGVRGSEKETIQESSEDVDAIIRKIKEGELKLPPSTRLSSSPSSSRQSQKPIINSDKLKDEVKPPRRKQSVSNSASRSSKRKEQHHQQQERRQQQQQQHFIPTPVGQQTTTETTQPEAYLTPATSFGSHLQYYSSPSSYYEDKYENDDIVSSTMPSLPLDFDSSHSNHIDPEQFFAGRATASSPSFESSTRNSFGENLGIYHLNNSGYITSLFSALKNRPSNQLNFDTVQLPFLPTTSGNSVVEKAKVNHRSNNTIKYSQYLEPTFAASTIVIPTSNRSVFESPTKEPAKAKRDRITARKTTKKPVKDVRKDNDEEESNVEETKTEEAVSTTAGAGESVALSDALKKEGFYAMAKFLRQSGLDSILNDTGPFTLFIPTDKAFRTLLIQLGGPDKAEEKFKENPRLLSGLLLHHVIPGAFRVNQLQDEMTGVSLAGTQLRANTYTTHDIEWNDITVVTVNGAKILDEKDIVIPQGIAHAIDRVMFPLPVGNLLQTLQADRENRYSNFLKIVEESNLNQLLTGGKTYTLFAPLNRAFTHIEFKKIASDPKESKSFVLRHLVLGALYSAGMKYYQVRDSLEENQQVTVYKEAGKIRVNTAHVITRNIPAINGVIHAIDAFL